MLKFSAKDLKPVLLEAHKNHDRKHEQPHSEREETVVHHGQ
ncbi:hypothetical protein ACOIVU_002995 [Escherichia coli]|nr:hypothetical protein [Escherichia coli]MDF1293307.1 hypothetical protein [Escherichia coli]